MIGYPTTVSNDNLSKNFVGGDLKRFGENWDEARGNVDAYLKLYGDQIFALFKVYDTISASSYSLYIYFVKSKISFHDFFLSQRQFGKQYDNEAEEPWRQKMVLQRLRA